LYSLARPVSGLLLYRDDNGGGSELPAWRLQYSS
jgi:hypothetical protein